MGWFWRGVAYAIDPNMAKRADRMQALHDMQTGRGQGPSLLSEIWHGWRAHHAGRQYFEESSMIQRAHSPHRDPNDLGHPPGCPCRYCMRGFIRRGFGL
jgi:hypothetical protein